MDTYHALLEYGIEVDVDAALDFCHGRGVLHQDVKQANVLVGADGSAIAEAVFYGSAAKGADGDAKPAGAAAGAGWFAAATQEHLERLALLLVNSIVPSQAPRLAEVRHLAPQPSDALQAGRSRQKVSCTLALLL